MLKKHVAKFTFLKYTAPALLMALLFTVVFANPVLAWSPPSVDPSENATQVILWPAGNFTIQNVNGTFTITINDLETIVDNAVSDVNENFNNQIQSIYIFVVLFGIAVLGFFDRRFLIVAGLGFIVYGFIAIPTLQWFSIGLVVFGILLFIKTFWNKKGKTDE